MIGTRMRTVASRGSPIRRGIASSSGSPRPAARPRRRRSAARDPALFLEAHLPQEAHADRLPDLISLTEQRVYRFERAQHLLHPGLELVSLVQGGVVRELHHQEMREVVTR